jgi:hypothetical protein
MVALPLGTFYGSFYYMYNGDQDKIMFSGLFAVIAVNIVIVAYVIMAWSEDDGTELTGNKKVKKEVIKSD